MFFVSFTPCRESAATLIVPWIPIDSRAFQWDASARFHFHGKPGLGKAANTKWGRNPQRRGENPYNQRGWQPRLSKRGENPHKERGRGTSQPEVAEPPERAFSRLQKKGCENVKIEWCWRHCQEHFRGPFFAAP